MPGKSWEKPRAEVPKAAKAPWEMIPVDGERVGLVSEFVKDGSTDGCEMAK